MARSGCAPGPTCTPRRTIIQPKAATARKPSCAAPWCWCRSSACRARRASPSACGCGGADRANPTWRVVWRAYVHRFDLEHTYRFCKQTLNWTTPRVRTPQQADRWTWLVTLAYTQLRLARRTIEDVHLPWEPPQRPDRTHADRSPCPSGISATPGDTRHTGKRAKTLRSLTRTPKRRSVRPRTALSGLQKSRLTSHTRPFITKPATHPMVGHPVLVKSGLKKLETV